MRIDIRRTIRERRKQYIRDFLLPILDRAVSDVKPSYTVKEERHAKRCLKMFCRLSKLLYVKASGDDAPSHYFIPKLYSAKQFVDQKRYCEACLVLYDMIYWQPDWQVLLAVEGILP